MKHNNIILVTVIILSSIRIE